MMQTLRNYMKHIMWIVAVSFIITLIFSWGMGGFKNRNPLETGVIGEVDGQKIMYQQFMNLVNQEIENTRAQSQDTELTEYRINSIREQVWQSAIRDILFSQEIQRLKIAASPEEILFHLKNNPPEFLRTNEQFQTDGQFDISKYQQALNDPRNYDAWIPVENYLRTLLPMEKLQQRVVASVRVTDEEVKETLRLENEKVNAKYAFFDPNVSMENISIAEEELRKYYSENRENYTEPEKRKIEYILFETKPSSEDSAQVRNDAMALVQLIKKGADFDELAKENSEDAGSAEKGGDLGFFNRGTMVPKFEDAAFSAKIGDIVGPVETDFGIHIIKVIARKKEKGEDQIQAKHILLKYKTSPETSDMVQNKAQYFFDEVTKAGSGKFRELAVEENLNVLESPFFQQGSFIPGLGPYSYLNRLIFRQKVGWISNPVSAGDNIAVVQLSELQAEKVQSFDEVRASVEQMVQRQKQKEKSLELCSAFRGKIQSPEDFERVAAEDSIQILETGLFALDGYIPKIGKDPAFAGAAFRLSENQISDPVEGSRGCYLIRLIGRIPFDEKVFESQKDAKRQELLQRKTQMAYMAWFEELRERADIKDYREQYF